MGTDVDVTVTAPGDSEQAVAYAKNRIETLEQMWSRFLDDSEVSKINRNLGSLVVVSSETLELAKLSLAAMEATSGIFSPFVRTDLAGYDKNFDQIESVPSPEFVPGTGALEVYESLNSLQLVDGQLDFGGIGKGFAADLVAEELARFSPSQVIVNIGGDMRVITADPSETTAITLELGEQAMRVAINSGAVATSSVLKRNWQGPDSQVSHLRDPNTGGELAQDLQAVSVLTDSAAKAEILVKLCIAQGEAGLDSIAKTYGCSGAALTDGEVLSFGQISDFQTHSNT